MCPGCEPEPNGHASGANGAVGTSSAVEHVAENVDANVGMDILPISSRVLQTVRTPKTNQIRSCEKN